MVLSAVIMAMRPEFDPTEVVPCCGNYLNERKVPGHVCVSREGIRVRVLQASD